MPALFDTGFSVRHATGELSFKQRDKMALLLDATVNALTLAGAEIRTHVDCITRGTCTTPICVLCALDEATAYQAGPEQHTPPPKHRPGPNAQARKRTKDEQRYTDYHEAGTLCRQLILEQLPNGTTPVDEIRHVLLNLAITIRMGGTRL